jgi:hypothetical protein
LRQEQARDEKKCDHRQARPQVGQDELGQQGDSALAGVAQIAAHADDAVEGGVDQRACVEAMRSQRMLILALRAATGAMRIGIGELLDVLLDRAGKWV